MNVDLWVVGLRILAAVLIVSVICPDLLDLRRWARQLASSHKDGPK